MLVSEVSKAKRISVCIGTFLLMFASAVVSNSTTYFIVAVCDEIGCTRASFSAYYSILQLATATISMCIAFFYSHFSMRKIFVAGTIGVVCGFLLLSRLTALWMVYAGALIIGIFQAFIIVPLVRVVNQWVPGKSNGIAIGLVMSASGFGGLMMGQIMPRVVAYINWRTGYLVCAGLYAVITIIGWILAGDKAPINPDTEVKEVKTDSEREKILLKAALKRPAFYVIVFICFLGCGSNAIFQHLSAHLQGKGLTPEYVANVMSIWSIALGFTKIAEGWCYNHINLKIFVPVLAVLSVLAYWVVLADTLPVLILGVILFALSGAAITAVYPSVINDILGKETTSAIWGFCWGGFQFGTALFVIIFGALFDASGSYNSGMILGGVGTLVVWIVLSALLIATRKDRAARKAEAKEQA